MNVRELLRYELWNKKASWKILFLSGISLAVLVILALFSYEVELHWLTPNERSAAKAALVEIDELQSAGSMNGEEFDVKEKRAHQKFEAARNAARTHRDEEIVATLSIYFILTTYRWDEARFDLEYPVASSTIDADVRSEREHRQSDIEMRKQLRSALHKLLD